MLANQPSAAAPITITIDAKDPVSKKLSKEEQDKIDSHKRPAPQVSKANIADNTTQAQQPLNRVALTREEQNQLNVELWETLDKDPLAVAKLLNQGADPYYVHTNWRWKNWSVLAYCIYKIKSSTENNKYLKYYRIAELLIQNMPQERRDFDQKFPADAGAGCAGLSLFAWLEENSDFSKTHQRWVKLGLGKDNDELRDYTVTPMPMFITLFLNHGANFDQITRGGEPFFLNQTVAHWILAKGSSSHKFIETAVAYDRKILLLDALQEGAASFEQKLVYPGNYEQYVKNQKWRGAYNPRNFNFGKYNGRTIKEYLEEIGLGRIAQGLQLLKEKEAQEKLGHVLSAPTAQGKEEPASPEQARLNRVALQSVAIAMQHSSSSTIDANKLTALFADAVQAAKSSTGATENYKASTLSQIRDKANNTPLHLAASIGASSDLLNSLTAEAACGINEENNAKETPLFQAVKNGHTKTVAWLIKNGANLAKKYHVVLDAKSLPSLPVDEKSAAERLKEYAKQYGHNCHYVPGDGNCFFHAVIHQLSLLKEKNPCVNETHETLRAKAIKHIRDNPHLYQNAIINGNIQEYITKYQRIDEWIDDQVIVLALARALKITMVIVHSNGNPPTIFRQRDAVATVFLGNEAQRHYWSLTPANDQKPEKSILADIQAAEFDNTAPSSALIKDNKQLPVPEKTAQKNDEKIKPSSGAAQPAAPQKKAEDKVEELTVLGYALATQQPIVLIGELLKTHNDLKQTTPGDHLSPLHLAAHWGNEDAIRYFVTQRNVPVDVPDSKEKDTVPLTRAVLRGHEQAMKVLLNLGASFDHQNEKGIKLLKQLDDASLPSDTKLAIKNHLTNHSIHKDREREFQTKHANEIAQAIFLALFHDASTKSNNSPIIIGLLQLVLMASPQILHKLNEAKENQQKFVTFITQHLMIGKVPDEKAKQKWLSILEKDPKEQSLFKEKTKEIIAQYEVAAKNSDQLTIDTIAAEVVAKLKLKDPIKTASFKRLISETLAQNKYQADICTNKHLHAQLITLIHLELEYSLNEKNDIKKEERGRIYGLKIQLALDCWCNQINKLSNDEKIAYELTNNIIDGLKKTCVGMKDKKINLARYIIKETFKDHVLFFLKNHPEHKNSFVHRIINDMKNDPMEHFSSSIDKQSKYRTLLETKIHNWYSVYSRYSFSRTAPPSRLERDPNMKGDIKQTPFEINKRAFIKDLLKRFDLLFGKFQALDMKLVDRIDEDIDKFAKTIEQHKDKLPKFKLMGFEVAIGDVAALFANLGVYLKDVSVAKAAKRITTLFELHDPAERYQVIKEAAEFIIERYRWQFEQLNPEGAYILASSAANRAIQHITSCDKNSIKDAPNIWDAAKAFFNSNEPSKKIAFHGPLGVLITGILRGKCAETDAKKISTHDEKRNSTKPWTAESIFENTGILAEDEQGILRCYTHKNVSKESNGEPSYGYCFSTLEDVRIRKYQLDEKAVPPIELVRSRGNSDSSNDTPSLKRN